jgi:hypothetical protein
MAKPNVLRAFISRNVHRTTHSSYRPESEIVFGENPGSRHGGADTVHQERVGEDVA